MVVRGSQPLSATPPLDVSIYSSAAGIPITQLATLQFPASNFSIWHPEDHRKAFDFSQFHIELEAAHEYIVTFGVANPVTGVDAGVAPYLVDTSPSSLAGDHSLSLGHNVSEAPDGISWHTDSSYNELGIVVRAVPEPSAIFLAIPAMAALPTRRRKSVPQDRV
jgi:hypothetical protein